MPDYSKQIVYLSQAQYAELIANGTITVDGVTVTYNKNDIYVTPQAEPVTDVRVAGTSVAANGVADIPVASTSQSGTVIVGGPGYGLNITNGGRIQIDCASASAIKSGGNSYGPIVPSTTKNATFYGLSRAAGDTTQSQSSNAIGTYTPEAKGAIQQMLGVSDLIAPTENTLIASKAYAIGDVFTANGKLYKATAAIAAAETIVVQNEGETISGHNAEEAQIEGTFVKKTDYANTSTAGVVKVSLNNGSQMINSVLTSVNASVAEIKTGVSSYKQVNPGTVYAAAFYGLAKAADDITQAASDNAVGTYTDSAKAAIQHMLGTDTTLAPYESDTTADTAYAIGELFMLNGKLHQAIAAIAIGDTLEVGTNCSVVNASEVFAHDVQANGVSVVTNGIANVPMASTSVAGLVKTSNGIYLNNGALALSNPSDNDYKTSGTNIKAVVPSQQHKSVFYGLAKAAGDTTMASSSNAVGQYTDNAKASIKAMLGIVDGSTGTVDVSGTTPSITAVENTRYVCGEVSTLSFTPPASGISIVRFTSGTTATVLTLPNTVKFPEWFDATSLEADTIYEICVTDGVYGAVMSWAL